MGRAALELIVGGLDGHEEGEDLARVLLAGGFGSQQFTTQPLEELGEEEDFGTREVGEFGRVGTFDDVGEQLESLADGSDIEVASGTELSDTGSEAHDGCIERG